LQDDIERLLLQSERGGIPGDQGKGRRQHHPGPGQTLLEQIIAHQVLRLEAESDQVEQIHPATAADLQDPLVLNRHLAGSLETTDQGPLPLLTCAELVGVQRVIARRGDLLAPCVAVSNRLDLVGGSRKHVVDLLPGP